MTPQFSTNIHPVLVLLLNKWPFTNYRMRCTHPSPIEFFFICLICTYFEKQRVLWTSEHKKDKCSIFLACLFCMFSLLALKAMAPKVITYATGWLLLRKFVTTHVHIYEMALTGARNCLNNAIYNLIGLKASFILQRIVWVSTEVNFCGSLTTVFVVPSGFLARTE